jgi:O-methyltransferase
MIEYIRRLLRERTIARRVARDDAKESLLETEDGRIEYMSAIAKECAESSLIGLLEKALERPGDVVECGVYRGQSLRWICKTVGDIAQERTVFALDSFEGFPPGAITPFDLTHFRGKSRLEGKFKGAEDVPTRLSRFAQHAGVNLDIRKGFFENTLPDIVDRKFCFIHIDCDTYSGHVEVLNSLYDRLVPGGTIVYDDYKAEAWPGATSAVDEFFADKPESIQMSDARSRPAWYSIKPE